MDLDYKLERFDILTTNYIDTINSLLDLAVSNKIVPFKLLIGLPLIKDYIQTNRIDLLEYGVQYILTNKSDIMNFDINKLDELDSKVEDLQCKTLRDNKLSPFELKIQNGQTKFAERSEMAKPFDSDSDDNISRKEYINNINSAKLKINNKPNLSNNFDSNEIIDIIVQIKNNSKNLDNFTIQMVRNYFELLILILEQIKSLY